MIRQAKVGSIGSLEDFRAALIIYLSKARPALENMGDDVRQTRVWLESDRRTHWEQAVRLRGRELSQAQQELFSARLSSLKTPTSTQQRAVARAKYALAEAEDKLRLVRKWCRDFENLTQPLVKEIEQAHSFLTIDMRHASDFLSAIIGTLEEYAEMAPPSGLAVLTPSDGLPAGMNSTKSGAAGGDEGSLP